MFIEFLGEERECVEIAIDDIYCKHESSYEKYRNNYRNQLKEIDKDAKEAGRNKRLCEILEKQGFLYPIALHKFLEGYRCIDGHHRIKAHLTLGRDTIKGIVYKDLDEALRAKRIPYSGEYGK